MEKEIRKANLRVSENSKENRTVQFVISTADKDRHGTVLNMKNWKLDNFNANPIVGYQHNVYGDSFLTSPDPDDILGVAKAWVEGDELIGEVTFETAEINPKADKIFKKVMNGTLKATSVGFTPLRGNDGTLGEKRGDTFYYHGQELLEFSIVNIPSNPKALKRGLEFTKMFIEDEAEIEKKENNEIVTDLTNENKSNNNLNVYEKLLTLKKLKK